MNRNKQKQEPQKLGINNMALERRAPVFDASPYASLGYGNSGLRAVHDAMLQSCGVYGAVGDIHGFPHFMGYGVLSALSQNGIVRAGVELRADEMTRRWIEFDYNGEASDEEAGNEVSEQITRFGLKRLFRDAAQMCGFFGGCLSYIDVGDISDEDLRLPLGTDSDTIRPGTIKGFKLVEPVYISPGRYSCANPIDKDYFVPQSWLVNGREIHASRFLYFAEDKPPTLLLPSYNFFGIPLVQIAMEAVKNFERTSDAAARLLQKFSCTVFATNMDDVMTGGTGENIRKRIQHFALYRDNDGVEVIDKETEQISESSKPLSGVTEIVRQQMELVAAMFGEPAVKLWGISPGGFNATGESDMQSHYEHIHAVQERIFRDPLEYVIRLLQLNSTGAVDDALTFKFVPLFDESKDIMARRNKTVADTYATLIDRGVISGAEARMALANDPDSGFANIDADAEIEPPGMALPMEEEETDEEDAQAGIPTSGN